jgi:anti-sigma factor RsiW
MDKVDPATLVAYRDGELETVSAGRVERALAADPELRSRLQSLKRVDTLLDAAFDPVLKAPLPALHLTERRLPAGGAPKLRHRPVARLAWAAGIAGLIVGFAAGHWSPMGMQSQEPIAAAAIQAKLAAVLETEVSGTTVAFADPVQGISGTVKPVSTFLNADGRYCRAYEARASHAEDTLTSRGIACRDGSGHWLTRVQVNAV